MTQRNLRNFGSKWRMLAAALALVGTLSFTVVPSQSALAAGATYSCGTYSAGAYSTGGSSCATNPGNTGGGSGVGAPNTGFAVLMQPANLMAILGSLALLVAGIIIMIKSRSRKKHSLTFDSRD
jgi:uncharacterized membrane protein